MKKIATITFHNSDNYGAIFQTKALQVAIENLGYETEIIDYICRNKIEMYKVFNWDLKRSLIKNIFHLLNAPYKYIKKSKVSNFALEQCKISTRKYYSSDEMIELENEYSLVITGSDQVWNYINTKFDKVYFLDFIKNSNQKMSYAPSFALTEIEEEYKEEYKTLLEDIKYLSVREKEGEKILNDFGLKAEVVLDPTLLLSKKDWNSIAETKPTKEKYILLYTLQNSRDIKDCAKKLSEETGLKVIKISSGIRDYLESFKLIIADPKEFISLINNAEYVVTDSFHGVAFSINLNKEFYFYRGKALKTHSRIDNLLRICQLEERSIESTDVLSLPKIDYKKTNVLLDKERKKSLDFLSNSIKKSLGE
ncbi:polysaccharide pyruvyl transferase family protein [uncultured Cetobacterium sp.]|uniref:polysaccharide pyruvyl transferase family protein n=1 Tax=uncultured Cetobacterium sp. TaxID=527638 RepID=UPI002600B780|nr:polysaccharide pyruvyl transferase family protein [uncultured Cetobacterium sp.]